MSVWVQLYLEGQDKPKGKRVQLGLQEIPHGNMSGLAMKVKEVWGDTIGALPMISVYPPGTTIGEDDVTDLDEDVQVNEYSQEAADENKRATPKTPLIVVAPPPPQKADEKDSAAEEARERRPHPAGEPPLKRALTSRNENFFAALPAANKRKTPNLLKFPDRIADTEKRFIFERPCYEPLAKKVKEILEDGEGNRITTFSSVIVTGSSGIGKTFFGFYIAHQLIQNGQIVAFNYRNQVRAVFAPELSTLQAQAGKGKHFLLKILENEQGGQLAPLTWCENEEEKNKGEDDVPKFWGIVTKDGTIWEKILGRKEAWLVVDLHANDEYQDGRKDCKIVVTSTVRKGDWPQLDTGGDTLSKKLYMGPLDLKEAYGIAKLSTPPILEDEIKRRFDLFGGSARLLFNDPKAAQAKVDEAFAAGAEGIIDPNAANPTMSSILVHILANDEFEQTGRQFASDTIAYAMIDAAIDKKQLEERIWLEATSGRVAVDIAGARGILAERLWHRAVKQPGNILVRELTPLGTANKDGEWKKLKEFSGTTRRFGDAAMKDSLRMDVGDYCLPTHKMFPTVDSLAVVKGAPWKQADDEDEDDVDAPIIGLMFQMAIGNTHKKAYSGTLKTIDQKMGDLVPGFKTGKSPLYLIYVTGNAEGFGPNQLNYATNKEGHAYAGALPSDLKRIKQFAVSFEGLVSKIDNSR